MRNTPAYLRGGRDLALTGQALGKKGANLESLSLLCEGPEFTD